MDSSNGSHGSSSKPWKVSWTEVNEVGGEVRRAKRFADQQEAEKLAAALLETNEAMVGVARVSKVEG